MSGAGVRTEDLGACVFGVCGADWPEDVAYYTEHLQSQLPLEDAPTVTNDAFNPLRAGTDDGVGVALVLGTGGAVSARGPAGAEWFSGERMERAGALELGRVVFDSLVRAEYADQPRPACEAAALRIFGVDSVEALIYAITHSGGTGYRSVARLAPALLAAAHEGDADSQRIVHEQGDRLAAYVRAAGRRVELDAGRRTLVMAGGLLRSQSSHLRDAVQAGLPDFRVEVSSLEPVHGAVLMAADRAQMRPPVARLVESGPPAAFFATTEAV